MKSFEKQYELLPLLVRVIRDALEVGLGRGQFDYFDRKIDFKIQKIEDKLIFTTKVARRELDFDFSSLQKISDFIVDDCLNNK